MVKVIHEIMKKLFKIENFYIKFILTVIAVALVAIAIELSNRNYYNTIDFIHDSVKIDGTVDVSGEVDTYEQNTIFGRKINQ